MKSSYELAMDRLSKASPTVELSAEQKKDLAELDSVCAAKIAERQIFLKGEMRKAAEKEDYEGMIQLEKQMASDRKNLTAELEEKKEKARAGGK